VGGRVSGWVGWVKVCNVWCGWACVYTYSHAYLLNIHLCARVHGHVGVNGVFHSHVTNEARLRLREWVRASVFLAFDRAAVRV
jgi:hypothetical protein